MQLLVPAAWVAAGRLQHQQLLQQNTLSKEGAVISMM
jgi:hypothetical protein